MNATLTSVQGIARASRVRAGQARSDRATLPVLLTVDEAADLLRTTRRAIYAMIERRQLPGVIRILDAYCFAPTTCYTGWTRSARHRRRSERR